MNPANWKVLPGCKLIGPKGEVELTKGVIVAKRHAHIPPDVAEQWGIKRPTNCFSKSRGQRTFFDFWRRSCIVSASAGLAVHIDTDEANAAGLKWRSRGRNYFIITC